MIFLIHKKLLIKFVQILCSAVSLCYSYVTVFLSLSLNLLWQKVKEIHMPLVFLNVSSFDNQNKSVRYNKFSDANMFYVNVTGFAEKHPTLMLTF